MLKLSTSLCELRRTSRRTWATRYAKRLPATPKGYPLRQRLPATPTATRYAKRLPATPKGYPLRQKAIVASRGEWQAGRTNGNGEIFILKPYTNILTSSYL